MQGGLVRSSSGRSCREDAVGDRWGFRPGLRCLGAQAAEIELEGNRLLVNGMLDGSAMKAFTDHLASGKVRTVVFENSFGGTAEAAGDFARAIRASGVNTEAKGQCHAACAYAFLAGKEHRFGRGLQVNGLLIPVAARPARKSWPAAGAARKPTGRWPNSSPTGRAGAAAMPASAPRERWQPDHGLLFTSTPTLFGRIYNSFYCDGTQGRDTSRCEVLSTPTLTSSAC